MKLIIAGIILMATAAQQQCNRQRASQGKTTDQPCYKGRLEIKGICSNYTIAVLSGPMDTSRLETSWTNESTGQSYKNVFALGSPCSFPNTIQEGEEFFFTLASEREDCAVCQAYYPKPSKSLAIKVLDKSCK